jgi:DNA-binding transcriptional MerR regulator
MPIERYEIVLVRKDAYELTVETLAQRAGLHPATVKQFVELGLIEPVRSNGSDPAFDAAALLRLRTIGRLRSTLGVNCAGAAIILDLLDKLAALRREIESMRSRRPPD